MNSEQPREQRRMAFLRQLALAMELPFVLVGGVAIGGGIGYLLDEKLHSSPWLTLIFGLFGFLGGFREVLRRLNLSGESGKPGEKKNEER